MSTMPALTALPFTWWRRRLCWVGLTGVLVILGVASFLWYRTPHEPPVVRRAIPDAEVAEAVETARSAVLATPRSAKAWGHYGMVLYAHYFLAEAIACFAEAERLEPREPRWPFYRAMALGLEDPDAAIPLLQRAVDLGGDAVEGARLRLAEVLLTRGRFQESQTHYLRLLHRDPSHAPANLGLGRLALERGDLEASLGYLRRAATNPFTRKTALSLQAEVQRRRGNANAARAALREADTLGPEPRWPDPLLDEVDALRVGRSNRMERVTRLAGQRRFDEAEAELVALARDYPPWEGALVHLGRIRLDRGNLEGARLALNEALARVPDSIQGQFLLGVVLYKQGRPQDAREHFERVVVLKPADPLAHYNLGRCLCITGQPEQAVAAFRTAVACKPDFLEAQVQLIEVLAGLGRTAEARAALRSALALDVNNPAVRRLLHRLFPRIPNPAL